MANYDSDGDEGVATESSDSSYADNESSGGEYTDDNLREEYEQAQQKPEKAAFTNTGTRSSARKNKWVIKDIPVRPTPPARPKVCLFSSASCAPRLTVGEEDQKRAEVAC